MATKYEWYTNLEGGQENVYTDHWGAQTFTVGTTGTNENFNVSSVKLKFYKYGSPTGTITVSIRATSGGDPTGSDLASGTMSVTGVTTDSEGVYYTITFGTPYELSASTQYAIVVRLSDGGANNNLRWRRDDVDATYTGGHYGLSTDSGVNWGMLDNYDYQFEVWGDSASGTNTQINIGDSWKDVSEMKINIGDSWKAVAEVKQNIGDTWKTVF